MPSRPRRSRWTPLLGLALVVVASACAGGGAGGGAPSPAPFDPTGRWEGTTTVLSRIDVTGTTLTMSGNVMGQALTLVLVVDGNSMAGTGNAGGDAGPITASRTPG